MRWPWSTVEDAPALPVALMAPLPVAAPATDAVPTPAGQSCATCVCFAEDVCKRWPPVLMRAHNGPQTWSQYPTVDHDDWCGEWRG